MVVFFDDNKFVKCVGNIYRFENYLGDVVVVEFCGLEDSCVVVKEEIGVS